MRSKSRTKRTKSTPKQKRKSDLASTNKPADAVQSPDGKSLPTEGAVKITDLVSNRKTRPPIVGVFPFALSTFWGLVKAGRLPKPIHPFGPRMPCYDVKVIRKLLEGGDK